MPCLSAKEPGHRAAVPNSMCEIGRGWEVVDVGLQQEAFKMWGLADVMEVDSLTCIKNRTRAGWWRENPTSYSLTASLQVDKGNQALLVRCGKCHIVEINPLRIHTHGLCIVQQIKVKFCNLKVGTFFLFTCWPCKACSLQCATHETCMWKGDSLATYSLEHLLNWYLRVYWQEYRENKW